MSFSVSSSSVGITALMSSSTFCTILSVISMRVPGGARKCSFIRPASTDGKKSVPMTNTSASDVSATPAATATVNARWFKSASSTRPYAF